MREKISLVVTSIAAPNPVLRALAHGAVEHGVQFIVIGDEKSPADFQLDGCRFYSLADQHGLDFAFAKKCPTRHYARKNIGYLLAMRAGAQTLIETDDDNFPEASFWTDRQRTQRVNVAEKAGWLNVYRYFSEANIWPRGLPLDAI